MKEKNKTKEIMTMSQNPRKLTNWRMAIFFNERYKIVVQVKQLRTHIGEGDLLDGLVEVVVPLRNLGLSRGKVGAEEAEGGGLQAEADGHGALLKVQTL